MKQQPSREKNRNIVLTAINAKYIHSNLAVYDLRAFAETYKEQITIAEYTINQYPDQVLMDLYRKKPDMLLFSCYIWNIGFIGKLLVDFHKVCPKVPVWLGGPEVSYDAQAVLKKYPHVKGVMKGEGEETFRELLECYENGGYFCDDAWKESVDEELKSIPGITWRKDIAEEDTIIENPWRDVMDLNKVPFIYDNMDLFAHKIIYYESSRGCPFSCSYCLSSVDKCLRFRDVEKVKHELQFFLDCEVPQVKFVDRTFNCRKDHAKEIWRYLLEHDKGKTNFHFEVAADLLDEEELELISHMRPGLIQLEIGVQSTNRQTIREIKRTMNFEKVEAIVNQIKEGANVHQHLDLIVGLPYEDYESFVRSFNQVFALHPEQLQLGFLKVLKGSYMHENRKKYGLVYKEEPPYEVLYTNWISYGEVLKLKGIEEMVEQYYNSNQFGSILRQLMMEFDHPFAFFEELSNFYREKRYDFVNHSRVSRYQILLEFGLRKSPEKRVLYQELIKYDLYLRENLKKRPDFILPPETTREERKGTPAGMHVERFSYNPMTGKKENVRITFNYNNRSPLTNDAEVFCIFE